MNKLAPYLVAAAAVGQVIAPADALANGNGKQQPSVVWDLRDAVGVKASEIWKGGILHVIADPGGKVEVIGSCPGPGSVVDTAVTFNSTNGITVDHNARVVPIGDGHSFKIRATAPAIPGAIVQTGASCKLVNGTNDSETVIISAGAPVVASSAPLPLAPSTNSSSVDLSLAVGGAVKLPSSTTLSPGENAYGAVSADADLVVYRRGKNTVVISGVYTGAPLSPLPIVPLGKPNEVATIETPEHCILAGAGYGRRLSDFVNIDVGAAAGGCFRQEQETGPGHSVPGVSSFVVEPIRAGIEFEIIKRRLGIRVQGALDVMAGGGETRVVPMVGFGLVGHTPLKK